MLFGYLEEEGGLTVASGITGWDGILWEEGR